MKTIGLYPIVDRASWLKRLLPLGIQTIQLRVKDLQGSALETEICQAIDIAEHYQAYCFINDYWQLAIKHQAYGVHLGQEDISEQACKQIQKAGLKLGISTHTTEEIHHALTFNPDYIAIGPIFPTKTKDLSYIPQGLEKLLYWVKTLDIPIVAIGGISVEHFQAVKTTGVSGIAVISAIAQAHDIERVLTHYRISPCSI
jgi:hydroxymethylpyrimidine kinase/phosphomethylpyrimidine kinase/thiamine-phosphate diphosphorylase